MAPANPLGNSCCKQASTAPAGSAGVESTLWTSIRPPRSTTKSVKVPPVSIPTFGTIVGKKIPQKPAQLLRCDAFTRGRRSGGGRLLGGFLSAARLVAGGRRLRGGCRARRAAAGVARVALLGLFLFLLRVGFAAALASVVGDVPAASLELERGRGDQLGHLAPAGRALRERL